MILLDFLKQNFHVPDEMPGLSGITKAVLNESFSFENDFIIKKTNERCVDELTIQAQVANRAGKLMVGVEELIRALKSNAPDKIISTRFIVSQTWGGRVYFDCENNLFGMILGMASGKNYVTPPDWDGSQKMLDEYNSASK